MHKKYRFPSFSLPETDFANSNWNTCGLANPLFVDRGEFNSATFCKLLEDIELEFTLDSSIPADVKGVVECLMNDVSPRPFLSTFGGRHADV